MKKTTLRNSVLVALALTSSSASAVTLEELAAKLDQVSAENAALKERLNQLEHSTKEQVDEIKVAQKVQSKKTPNINLNNVIRSNSEYSYQMLDPTTRINSKQRLILEKKKTGDLANNSVYFGGAVTPIANYQRSDTEAKFGYLMRHPTSGNQRTKEVSEAVIHSAQLAVTGTVGDWITGYAELLYNPEQSFGSGTLTDLNRNQVQVRRGYVLLGNLDKSPYYASLGKMAIPFGLTDTVNPFTNSTVWHSFGGLAYGLNLGYTQGALNANIMAVQGGAQFRSANVPVDGTNVPSKLNNWAADVNYTSVLSQETSLLLGASYIKGSPYCQGYPVRHFDPCEKENGAYDVYARLDSGQWQIKAEFAQTEDELPGSFNPAIPQFSASKVRSWDVGTKYSANVFGVPTDYSFEFSRFRAGDDGAPWEKQDQWVLGLASFVTPSAKLFAEYIHTDGYVPLNFLSGGNPGGQAGQSWSVSDANSDILLVGANIAF